MNFSDILTDIYSRTKLGASPAADEVALVKSMVNQRHRDILSSKAFGELRNDNIPFVVEQDVAVYALPPQVSKVLAIYDPLQNSRKLTERSLSWLRATDHANNNGIPYAWVPLSLTNIQVQPASNTRLYVVSTDAAENCNATVEYTREGGFASSGVVNLNGITAAQIGTDTDIISVQKFYLDANAVGTVSLVTSAVDGDVLSTIARGHVSETFKRVQLSPAPSQNTEYQIDYTREIRDMVDPTDEPLLPRDFHRILAVGGRMDWYEQSSDDRFPIAKAEYTALRKELLDYVLNNPDLIVVPGGQQSGGSMLGSQYPNDYWYN